MTQELCPCGQPLHYEFPSVEAAVRRMIELYGEFITITPPKGPTYKVPRHYAALHGYVDLDKMGFEEVPEPAGP